jgi:hypothetical protein
VVLWIPLIVLAALFGVITSVGGVAAMFFQHATDAMAPSGVTFQIEVGPTAVPWIGTLNWDGTWIAAPVHWFRYLRHPPRTWSVSVCKVKKRSLEPTLITEEYETYRAARLRFREIKRQIAIGELILGERE